MWRRRRIVDPAAAAFTGPKPDITVWGVALSAMHVPTGLFLRATTTRPTSVRATGAASGYWGQSTAGDKKDAVQWLVQGGISKNWFGYGNTSLYGEYGKATDWGADNGRCWPHALPVPAGTRRLHCRSMV